MPFALNEPGHNRHPTLEDFWEGRARFVQDIENTGLPMGESDTLVRHDGELWSYVHASSGSGTLDSCGEPVTFPGCVVIYKSLDGGRSFRQAGKQCLIPCRSCPCTQSDDHIDQQQYPRLSFSQNTVLMAYEHGAQVFLRRSSDGVVWSAPTQLPYTGVRMQSHRPCAEGEAIGPHPFAQHTADCLSGGPPGLIVEGNQSTVFVGRGQNPGSMACYTGRVNADAKTYRACRTPAIFQGATSYGPTDSTGVSANAFFDFRTISSADVIRVGERYYMLYEGVRGPGPNTQGDTQFGLGLARSSGMQLDGAWERFPGNPLLVNLPGNIGLGHADIVVLKGQTFVYTSLDGWVRGRLALVWT